ncbi:MAG: hypothetical protein IJI68_09415 [Eggerthellaceae bacterium]|nr:hypothetical protein [Eggerthellaceae bacterium]
MKKLAAIAVASVLAFALAGCSSQSASSSESASSEAMSASDVSESASSESASSESAPSLKWTEAKTAEEAAKGAGLDEFIVPEPGTKISLGELNKWSFCYAEDRAEADGGAAAAEIVIRKSIGNGDNTQELSEVTGGWADLKGMTYANEWNVSMDGTDVRCYGNEKGKVSKAIWAEDKYSYSILVLGQGDNWQDFGIDEDDIAVLVKGTKKAEVKEEEKSEKSEPAQEQPAEQPRPEGDPGLDFNQLVWDNGLGQYEYTGDVFQAQDGAWYWPVYSRGADGKLYAHYFDTEGNLAWSDTDPIDDGTSQDGVSNLTEADIQNLVWENGLGEYVSAEYNPSDGLWRVITHDVNGSEVVILFNDQDSTYVIP